MGACGSDLYSLVKKQHGQQFHKFIVGEHLTKQFTRLTNQRLASYDSNVETKRLSLHQIVNQKEKSIKQTFQKLKKSLDEEIPGGVSSLEQMRKQPLNRILGLEQYQKRFQGVHEQVDRELNQRKQQTHNQMHQLVSKVSQEYKVDPEKMRLVHETSQEKRAILYDRGVREYQNQISEKVKSLSKQYEQALSLKSHEERLGGTVSMEHVDHLFNVAQNKLKSQAFSLVGGGFDSSIKI